MCFSNATLFYGLWVTTASLDFAATAHKATRPTFLAIDLIISRRRSIKLEITGQDEKTTVRDLPEEVWELVEDQLLGLEAEDAEQDRLKQFRCNSCDQAAREDVQETYRAPSYDWSHWCDPWCDVCYQHLAVSNILRGRTPQQLADIATLLKHYHLQLPSQRMWKEKGPECHKDFETLMAISLPLRSALTERPSDDRYPAIVAIGDSDEGCDNSVFNVTPEAFIAPADANARFHRLVSSYRLDVRDRTRGSILPLGDPRLSPETETPIPAASDGKADNSATKKKAEVKKERSGLFAKAEPRWMLWSLVVGCT